MKFLKAPEPILFFAFLVMLLMPVWSVDFFVTGDGPCHLYNSKILLDWQHTSGKAFYDPFFYLNTEFNPNLLYYIITVPLLAVFPPGLAEKIFFTIYILGFGLGFRYLISVINPKSKFISSVALLFCYHTLLMHGFLNNTLSFAVWFWVVGWCWSKRDDVSMKTMICTALLLLLLYSTHPMGLIFGMLMVVCMMAGQWIKEIETLKWRTATQMLIRRASILFLCGLPTIMLFVEYMLRSNMSKDTSAHHFKDTLNYISHLYSLVIVQTREEPWALATSIICFLTFIIGLIMRLKQRHWKIEDGLWIYLILVLLIIFNPPNSIAGGLEISFRMAFVPFIIFLVVSSISDFPYWIKTSIPSIAFVIGLGFLIIRMPVHRDASEYAKEVYSCRDSIKEKSTLFVLNYDWEGHTPDGKLIADRAGLFMHVDCYLGAGRTMLISDNYESHFPYFPVVARWNTNMYSMTDKEGINFDNRPPRADILNYNKRTGENIDYVLLLGYRKDLNDQPYVQEVLSQLDQEYAKIFTSSRERAILYERKQR